MFNPQPDSRAYRLALLAVILAGVLVRLPFLDRACHPRRGLHRRDLGFRLAALRRGRLPPAQQPHLPHFTGERCNQYSRQPALDGAPARFSGRRAAHPARLCLRAPPLRAAGRHPGRRADRRFAHPGGLFSQRARLYPLHALQPAGFLAGGRAAAAQEPGRLGAARSVRRAGLLDRADDALSLRRGLRLDLPFGASSTATRRALTAAHGD